MQTETNHNLLQFQIHPLSGQKLEESDIIPLQRGGTGYAAANNQLKAKHYRPSLAIN